MRYFFKYGLFIMKRQNFTVIALFFSLLLSSLSVLAVGEKTGAHPFSLSPDIKFYSMEVMKSKEAAAQPATQAKKPKGPMKTAKVVEVLAANEYSYLQVEVDNTKVWIAGIKITAKEGDTIQYAESVTMDNFLSKSLNRTFKKLVFVSNVSTVK